MTEPRPEAVTAAARPILRRLPSLGEDRCRSLARDALRAAQPYLGDTESQDALLAGLRAGMATAGLTARQRAQVEGLCARLIEAAARRPYPVKPAARKETG